MNILMQLVGRLHPIIVHLPIGFIILGLLLLFYDRKKGLFKHVIGLSFLWGGLSAVAACVTGYLLYQTDGFAFDTVKIHLWMGIITAIFCFFAYGRVLESERISIFNRIPTPAFFIILFLLISYTGHLGGSITHGEEYLVEPLPNRIKSALGIEVFEEKTIILDEKNWQDANLYEEIINPILNNKCFSCHNSKKNKGELMLQSPEMILKGGENGEVIVPNHPDKSALYTKLVLPKDDDDHMPPEGKTQLTKEEIKIISAWIEQGSSFDKSIQELGLKKELLTSFFPRKIDNDYPDVFVEEAAQNVIKTIEIEGVHVEKISKESNFLNVTCINKSSFNEEDFNLLIPIAKQIAILDLGGTLVTDIVFYHLKDFPNLTILKLDNTAITGKDIDLLVNCENLKILNLSSTKFEASYLESLTNFKNLKTVFLHNTSVKSDASNKLKPETIRFDFGNYDLPLIESDSIVY